MSLETGDTYAQLSAGKIPGEDTGIEIRKSICSICNPHSHCGIDASVKDGVIVKIEGTKENPHSEGTLCSKGNANRQYVYHKDRIRTPLQRRRQLTQGLILFLSRSGGLLRDRGLLPMK